SGCGWSRPVGWGWPGASGSAESGARPARSAGASPIAACTAGCSRNGERSWESFASSRTAYPPRCSRRIVRPMRARSWSTAPGVILGTLTALNLLNYLDRYVSAATLPLILRDLAISDAQGGLLQSLFIVAYALACGPAGWLGDSAKRLRIVATELFV